VVGYWVDPEDYAVDKEAIFCRALDGFEGENLSKFIYTIMFYIFYFY